MKSIYLKVPNINELHYRQEWMKNSKTMSYNAGYDIGLKGYDKETGTITKSNEEMIAWYNNWINQEPDKYFAYIYDNSISEPIGEVYYYLDNGIHSMGIVIQDKYRGKGYSYMALLELQKVAFEKNNISELSDFISLDRIGAIKAFEKAGFMHTGIEKKELVFGKESISKQLIITKESYFMQRRQLPTWQFGINNDKLVELVLEGKKTATTSLDSTNVSKPGERSILTFENEKKACIVETKKVIITKFKNITSEMAFLEGEGNRTLDYYKKAHADYFKTIEPNFNDETEVCFEIFEVIEDLRKTRLALAERIVNSNEQIFGNNSHTITEINAGFNNDLFDIDNKYIIKVCGNGKEDKFEKENLFYIKNSNSTHIPKLYKYDNTKIIVDSVYEIISKIEGKSLYYYWYKINETEREAAIKELIDILKDIHKSKCEPYNWTNFIKSQIQDYYKEIKKYFSTEEQKLIEQSFTNYDEYLKDNKFAFIHNDLHFDNIIKNDNGLYLIDFNDAMTAPIDYEFRLLFRCKDMPWKWANSEMDPFQKPEDYKNIDTYIKKYYKDFSDIKYIDERMIIYSILDDIRLLTRFDNNQLKEDILNFTKKLINLK